MQVRRVVVVVVLAGRAFEAVVASCVDPRACLVASGLVASQRTMAMLDSTICASHPPTTRCSFAYTVRCIVLRWVVCAT
jgi:hypothetical protein